MNKNRTIKIILLVGLFASGAFSFSFGQTSGGVTDGNCPPNPMWKYECIDAGSKGSLGTAITHIDARVGIGTISPTQKLEVVGNVKVNGILTANGLNIPFFKTYPNFIHVQKPVKIGNSIWLAGSLMPGGTNDVYTDNSDLLIQSNSLFNFNTIINADNTGRVGIGTIAPSTKLEVNGSISNGGTDFILGKLDGRQQGSIPYNRALVHGGIIDAGLFADDVLGINYAGDFEGGTQIMGSKLVVNGDVGIGTNAPSTNLEVIGGTEPFYLKNQSNPNLYFFAGVNRDNGGYVDIGSFETGIGWRNLILNRSGGNVGIGTTSPQSKLQVKGNYNAFCVESDPNITDAQYSDIVFKEGPNDNQRKWVIRSHNSTSSASRALEIGSARTDGQIADILMVGPNSTDIRVGIGTSPTHPLHIKGASPSIRLEDDATPQTGHTENADFVLLNDNGAFRIRRGSGDLVWVESSGRMSVCHLVVRSMTGCDFVFDKDYKLKSIPELADFIKINKHLPDIPPASEMENNGINVAEMQSKLLQKVEELTLYMIDLKKENDELKERINLVEKK